MNTQAYKEKQQTNRKTTSLQRNCSCIPSSYILPNSHQLVAPRHQLTIGNQALNTIKQLSEYNISLMASGLWQHKTQGINYDLYRPTYPSTLLQQVHPEPENGLSYLDVATGTGQLLFNLYNKFEKAYGVDVSQQMAEVSTLKASEICKRQGEKIKVARKDCLHAHEVTGEEGKKFDLVTVGEALHWFQIDQFLKYVKDRLLTKEGTLGIFGYYISTCQFLTGSESTRSQANDIYYEYYNTIEPYFAFRMGQLDECYTEPKYTFANHFKKVERTVELDPMDMEAADFVRFFKTYSGYNTYLKQTGRDLAVEMQQKVAGRKVRMWVKYFLIKCTNEE